METFSAYMALCAGNSPVNGEFPSQRPVTRGFDVFFDLRLNKRLSKQSRRRWFGTYRAHYDVTVLCLQGWSWLLGWSYRNSGNGPLPRCVKLRDAHAPGMPGTFSPPPWVGDPDMYHGTCVTRVPWWSLTSGFLWSRWRGKRSLHPGACATHNFTYLVRGPWQMNHLCCECFNFNGRSPFYLQMLTMIMAWINNDIHSFCVW